MAIGPSGGNPPRHHGRNKLAKPAGARGTPHPQTSDGALFSRARGQRSDRSGGMEKGKRKEARKLAGKTNGADWRG